MSTTTPPSVVRWRERLGDALVLLALATLCVWFHSLHEGDWHWSRDRLRWSLALLALAGYGIAVAIGAWRRRAIRVARAPLRDTAITVWFASQTGLAEQLAQRSAERLRQAGLDAQAAPLSEFEPTRIVAGTRALFVASTTGEGDAPDSALRFVRERMTDGTTLRGLRYGVLALGDRTYADFCAFGHRLDDWLRQRGAQPLFDRVEVDDGDEGALRHWQHHLDQLGGRVDLPDWQAPHYRPWRLHARRPLNPGSAGGAVFHLELVPDDPRELQWQAGDIAEIGPRQPAAAVQAFLTASGWDGDATIQLDGLTQTLRDALSARALPDAALARGCDAAQLLAAQPRLPHREYSIASIPRDGALHLTVRQLFRPDGALGLGAGWLTQHAALGTAIDLRLRRNPGFHAPPDDRPLILIGNGSGIAGLRALWRERLARGHRRNWLLFGERNAAHDAFYRDEIAAALGCGGLARVDYAWSRDGHDRVYVQQRVREAADALRHWVGEGASIHVCGSLQGMAPAVDAALRDVLGEAQLDALRDAGRYRRDVY